MKRRLLIIISLFYLIHPGSMGSGNLDPALIHLLQKKLDSCVNNYNLPGISVSLIFPSGDQWNGVSGLSHIYNNTPMDTSLLFHQASVTKMIIAGMAFELIDQGLLSLEDTVGAYIFPPINYIPENIKIKNLLRHRSGLFNYLGSNPSASSTFFTHPDSIWTPRKAIETYGQAPVFSQGTQFAYSNTNFIVLGVILESIYMKLANEIILERIKQPLNINQTFLPPYDSIAGPKATGWTSFSQVNTYDTDASLILNNASASLFYTSGALVSKPSDMAKITRAILTGQFFSDSTLTLMKTSQNVNLGQGVTGYAYGLSRQVHFGKKYFGHGGDINGFTQLSIHGSQDSITLSLNINRNSAPRGAIASAILSVIKNYVPTDIKSGNSKSQLSIYPNPSNGHFTLEVNNNLPNEHFKVTLQNMQGNIIYKGQIDLGDRFLNTFNFSNMGPGIYILELAGRRNIYKTKICIK